MSLASTTARSEELLHKTPGVLFTSFHEEEHNWYTQLENRKWLIFISATENVNIAK